MCPQIPISFYGRIPGVSLIPSSIVTPPSDCQEAHRLLQIYCQNPATEFQKSHYFEIPQKFKTVLHFFEISKFQKISKYPCQPQRVPTFTSQLSTRMWHILYLILYVNLLLFPKLLCKTWYMFSSSKLSQNPVLKWNTPCFTY